MTDALMIDYNYSPLRESAGISLEEAWSDAARAAAAAARRVRAHNRSNPTRQMDWRKAMDQTFKKHGGRTSKVLFQPSKDRPIGVDSMGRARDGSLVARRGYFYSHGQTAEGFGKVIKKAFPKAKIMRTTDHWKPFRGGSSLANSSHFEVVFKHPRRWRRTV